MILRLVSCKSVRNGQCGQCVDMDRQSLFTKSYDLAADVSKQIISLSVALVASFAILSRLEVFNTTDVLIPLRVAVGSYFLSILLGLICLMGMSGNFNKMAFDERLQSVEKNADGLRTAYDANVRWPGILQIALFLIGMLFTIYLVLFSASADTIAIGGDFDARSCNNKN